MSEGQHGGRVGTGRRNGDSSYSGQTTEDFLRLCEELGGHWCILNGAATQADLCLSRTALAAVSEKNSGGG